VTRNRKEKSVLQTARFLGGTTYVVLEDFGRLGLAFRETDPEHADFESVIGDILAGQFERPLRVIAFNIREDWARDVSSQIAAELIERSRRANSSLNVGALNFLIASDMKRKLDRCAAEITRGQMCLFSNDELESV
jgi:hypothetical protein